MAPGSVTLFTVNTPLVRDAYILCWFTAATLTSIALRVLCLRSVHDDGLLKPLTNVISKATAHVHPLSLVHLSLQ